MTAPINTPRNKPPEFWDFRGRPKRPAASMVGLRVNGVVVIGKGYGCASFVRHETCGHEFAVDNSRLKSRRKDGRVRTPAKAIVCPVCK